MLAKAPRLTMIFHVQRESAYFCQEDLRVIIGSTVVLNYISRKQFIIDKVFDISSLSLCVEKVYIAHFRHGLSKSELWVRHLPQKEPLFIAKICHITLSTSHILFKEGSLAIDPLTKLLGRNGTLIQSIADQPSGQLLQAFFLHSLESFTESGFFLLGYGVAFNDFGIDQITDCVGMKLDGNRVENSGEAAIFFEKVDTFGSDFTLNGKFIFQCPLWAIKHMVTAKWILYQAVFFKVFQVESDTLFLIISNFLIREFSEPIWVGLTHFNKYLLLKISINHRVSRYLEVFHA